jgi:hypothetical protein
MSEDEKIVILITNLGSVNKSNVSEDNRRAAISNFFEKYLTTKPDFVFVQEIQKSQIDELKKSLEKNKGMLTQTHQYAHCQVKEYGSSHNAIFWNDEKKEGQTVTEHKDVWQENGVQLGSCDEFQISSKRFRFTVLTRGIRSVLLVNYHGERNGIAEKERVQNFLVYLQLFQKFKVQRDCNYLVIGGDFNFDLDTFAENNQTFLDEKYNLKVVPYQSERKRKTKKGNIRNDKVDGLICDKEMWIEDAKVEVFPRKNASAMALIGGGGNASLGADILRILNLLGVCGFLDNNHKDSEVAGEGNARQGAQGYDYSDDESDEDDEEAGHEEAGHEEVVHEEVGHEEAGHEEVGHEEVGHEEGYMLGGTFSADPQRVDQPQNAEFTDEPKSEIPDDVLGHDPVLFTLRLPKENEYRLKDVLIDGGILEPRFLEKRNATNICRIKRRLLGEGSLEKIFSNAEFMMTEMTAMSEEKLRERKIIYEEELKKILLTLPEYSLGERKRLAMITACWFITDQLSPTILEVLFNGQVDTNQRPLAHEFSEFFAEKCSFLANAIACQNHLFGNSLGLARLEDICQAVLLGLARLAKHFGSDSPILSKSSLASPANIMSF